ncbi:TetR/AcrR family transcriptional regulator [Shewanella sp. D64]|uniref:TetR/AcrR family transcriptional regulator n=1 Tax=unclassified Shewanella TaxID=196818 RepID=UPI0022BA6D48|nr:MULTISPECIES: TetR/AcrR family transcriptional regulator [unclassified Shewanella]MEC4724707.1 TetR/AcrR family transcriptional regulator [Shewanella sp. D64]MEC4736499.1 TetR/AcrR family transcriptional regulator [Shewanella sp. E94]WBJ97447.1 TetR/AcrR family transcriptional regulator [Shewanella sp. MTB7]
MMDKQQDIFGSEDLVDLLSARGRLQQASASLFKAKGYSQTTVRDIAAKVGIQSGSIFHHFKNKEQILVSVMADSVLRVLLSMESGLAIATSTKDKISCLIQCELNAIHDEELAGFRLLISEWRSLSGDNQKKILCLRDRYEAIWSQVLNNAQSEGLIHTESFYLRGFIRGATIETCNWYKPSGSVSLAALTDKLMLSIVCRV